VLLILDSKRKESSSQVEQGIRFGRLGLSGLLEVLAGTLIVALLVGDEAQKNFLVVSCRLGVERGEADLFLQSQLFES
jgi:hypothetical protein